MKEKTINLPELWMTKKLGDLCDIARGGSPRPIQQYLTNSPDGINWIKISDALNFYTFDYKFRLYWNVFLLIFRTFQMFKKRN